MAHSSGNQTWQDFPSTATLITAQSLENIEGILDGLAARVDSPHARYYCAVAGGQNITADGTPKNIPFDVALDTHADVTRGSTAQPGVNYLFTLQRAGVWSISAGCRFQSTAGTLNQFMIWNGANSGTRYAETQQPSGVGSCITTTRRFPAGAVVAAGLAILNTSTASKVATDVPESTFFAATWLYP